MARLEVELDNITDVLKKKWTQARNTLEKLDVHLPTDLNKLLESTSLVQKEGKERLEKILHFLGIPTLRDFEKLNKKVDQLSKSKKTKKS